MAEVIPKSIDIAGWARWVNSHCHDALDSIKNRISSCDLDGVHWHLHGKRILEMFLIEYKSRGAIELSLTQETAHSVIDAALQRSDGAELQVRVFGRPQNITLRYTGYHLITCDGDDPDLSSEIFWDGHLIDRNILFQVLRFEIPASEYQFKETP